ncbi:hypothetical protein R6Q59_024329 [Mikania micrantha]
MELMVLTTLEWKMCEITQFAYLYHSFSKILPSLVAIATILLACDDQLTRTHWSPRLVLCHHFTLLKKQCYNLLKELEIKKNTTSDSNSFNSLRNHWTNSSNIGIKRKLKYNGFEQK